MAAAISMLTTSRPCGNICCFDQNYQPLKISLQVSFLSIEYLVAVSFELWMMERSILLALISVVAEIIIEKIRMHVW